MHALMCLSSVNVKSTLQPEAVSLVLAGLLRERQRLGSELVQRAVQGLGVSLLVRQVPHQGAPLLQLALLRLLARQKLRVLGGGRLQAPAPGLCRLQLLHQDDRLAAHTRQ